MGGVLAPSPNHELHQLTGCSLALSINRSLISASRKKMLPFITINSPNHICCLPYLFVNNSDMTVVSRNCLRVACHQHWRINLFAVLCDSTPLIDASTLGQRNYTVFGQTNNHIHRRRIFYFRNIWWRKVAQYCRICPILRWQRAP